MIFPREDFPLIAHSGVSYLDNAATTQKPQKVLDAMSSFYAASNAPVHRGIYDLAEQATVQFELARSRVASFCGALPEEIVFTQGTTSALNCVASSWAEKHLAPGDEIIISVLEHHSNLLPWIRLEQEKGIVLTYIPITKEGLLDYKTYRGLLSKKTKLVAITHTSNVLGTHVDLPLIISEAHKRGAAVLVDAAQAVGHEPLNVRALGVDFAAFSGHKMMGPTGIGVLYVSQKRAEEIAPYQLGGGMVRSVELHRYQPVTLPHLLEAGTPPFAEAIGLAAAIEYSLNSSYDELRVHEASLCAQLIAGLEGLTSFRILGPIEQLKQTGHMVSFVSSKAHAHDIAAYLNQFQVSVRAGNHCAQPLHKLLGVDASVRASFYGYTSAGDVDRLIEGLTQFEKSF